MTNDGIYTKVVGVSFEGRQKTIDKLIRQEKLDTDTELSVRLVRAELDELKSKAVLSSQETARLAKLQEILGFDNNAVAVYGQDEDDDWLQLGFLSKDLARQIAGELAAGKRFTAIVTAVTGGDVDGEKQYFGINILLKPDDYANT